jgi:uncharacterized protein
MLRKILFITFCLLTVTATCATALDVPDLAGKRFHNESTSLKPSDAQVQAIEEKLANMEKEYGGMQMAVLIIESLQGESMEDFSLRVAEKWKLGQKRRQGTEGDNGLLLTVAVQDRKYRFEVGYGLEGTIPDGMVGTIGRAVLVPEFREGRYINGIEKAIDAIGSVLQAVHHASAETGGTEKSKEEDIQIDKSVWAAGIMLLVAAGFGIAHFLLGGAVGLVEGAAFSWVFIGHGFPDLLLCAAAGFFLGMAAKIIVRIAFELGISGALGGRGGFSGGGGGFGGGGASGSW